MALSERSLFGNCERRRSPQADVYFRPTTGARPRNWLEGRSRVRIQPVIRLPVTIIDGEQTLEKTR